MLFFLYVQPVHCLRIASMPATSGGAAVVSSSSPKMTTFALPCVSTTALQARSSPETVRSGPVLPKTFGPAP